MKVAVFGTKPYDKKYFSQENKGFNHELVFLDVPLNSMTATLARGFKAVCVFVNDEVDKECLKRLSDCGVRAVALRCAGFNNVDLGAASSLGIVIVRVPEYSPHGVAEHAVALILALNRKIYRAYNRVREGNFLLEGLLGFNLNTKTIGVIGTGKIGSVFCHIMKGFGCSVLAYDPYPNENCAKNGIEYTDLKSLLKSSDIVSLHCPLTPETRYLIDEKAISCMKDGVMLINTSRGALIDTVAVIKNLKSGKIGYLGLDVYEEEGDLFFEDISDKILEDDVFARLLTFQNVLITGHQAFFTGDALTSIAKTTLQNLTDIEQGKQCANAISVNLIKTFSANK
ncbi:MAG: 2-hydroxyacid dehydrogenase [Chitinispirillaceae bacterium]|nr:2-hydroxyacid dehydrogenase [Chitinispirillaceae bacterium]